MRRTFYYIAIITAALLLSQTGQAADAHPGKGGGSRAGGVAASHMSEKGSENTNAQWSADPERGWRRAEERQELHKKGKSQRSKKQAEDSKAKRESGPWNY